MNFLTIIIYIIFIILLGIILKRLENKHQNNFSHYIIISNIYIFILSGIFKYYKITYSNIFLISLFQIRVNLIFVTTIKEVSIIKNNNYNLKKYLLTIITTYLLNILIINKLNIILPTIEEIKIIIWIFIMIYIYSIFKNNIKKVENDKIYFYQDKEYIVMQYAKYKNKYYKETKIKEKDLIPLIYSIMIYENYYKPNIFRVLDKYKYLILKNKNKYGIMQIDSNKYIDDITSINLSIKKLEKIYKTTTDIEKIITEYYKKENKEVFFIYKEIIEFIKK